MKKSPVLRRVAVLALLAAVAVAAHQFDLVGVIKRLHGID